MPARTTAPARHRLACCIALAFALPSSGPLAAEADSMGPAPEATQLAKVVVTAAGFEQKLTDAPASISVITREELDKRPYLTLIDVVRDLEGVDVGETSDKTGQRTISLRGMGSDYTLILIDGRRQNNHGDIYPNNFGGNQFNHIPPLDMIERIEVIRGPASTLYGADALGGVINIITRKVGTRWTGSATLGDTVQEDSAFGSDSSLDFALAGPLLGDVLGLGIRGARYQRDASSPEYEVIRAPDGTEFERALDFGSGGRTVDNRNTNLGATLSFKPNELQSVVLEVDRSKQEYDNTPFINNLGTETYPLGTVDGLNGLWRSAPRVGYGSDQSFTRNQWALTHEGEWGQVRSVVSLSGVETANNGRTLPLSVAERVLHKAIFNGTGDYAGLDVAARKAIMAQTLLPRPKRAMESRQNVLDAKFDVPIEGGMGYHHVVLGGQAIDGELEDGVFGMESGTGAAGVVQAHRMWSLFAEDNWSPIDAFTLTAGLRHDEHNLFGGHLSPRLYGNYSLSDTWTLKGGVSTGYKTPKTTDMHDGITGFGGQGTIPWAGNPDLTPETSVNSEVALYWTSADEAHNFNITAFHNNFKDKIERAETSRSCTETGGVRPCVNLGGYWSVLGVGMVSQLVNVDKARIQGVEVAGRYGINDAWALRGNYTLTDSERRSGADLGLPLTQTARHMANAVLEWNANDAFSAQLVAEAHTRRYRGKDADGDPMYYEGYTVLHLAAQYAISANVRLAARINNLLDQDFTGFETRFTQNPDGSYTPSYIDDYNNKDKARNLWLSVNVGF